MKRVRSSAFAVLVLVATLFAGTVAAQSAPQLRVAIANPAEIFNQIQETKDLQSKFNTDLAALEEQRKARELKLRDLQQQRDQLKPDTPQWAERNEELLRNAIEFEVWQRQTRASLERTQKQQMKVIFDRITEAVGQIAQQKGLDLVIAEVHPEVENLDQINVQELRARLVSRNVLYNAASADITSDVVAAMDQRYKSGQ